MVEISFATDAFRLLVPSHFKISADFQSFGGGAGRNSLLWKGVESIPD